MLVVLLGTADIAFARPVVIVDPAYKEGIIKILLAMLGVAGSTILLTVGLTIYNKFFVPDDVKNYKLGKYSLRSPTDKDEAILMYLTKNKLK